MKNKEDKIFTESEVRKLFKKFHKHLYGSTNQNPYAHGMNISEEGVYFKFEEWLNDNIK